MSGQASKSKLILVTILSLGLVFSTTFVVIQFQHITYLETRNSELETRLIDVESAYENLSERYSVLFSDYETIRFALEDPIETPTIPTYEEVLAWLLEDDTNDHQYNLSTWNCGDYAVMLMIRAKTMNWRMRLAILEWSYEGNASFGSTEEPYGVLGHAFNLIECTDGVWYIEPQTDCIWYPTNSTDHRTEFVFHEYYDLRGQYLGTVWDNYLIWINFYDYLY